MNLRKVLTLERLKAEGERIPLGYGAAWRDFERAAVVCYPLGVHLLRRWLRDARFWLMELGYPGYRQQIEQRAFLWGRRAGYDAYQAGRESVWKELEQRVLDSTARPRR